MLLRSSLLVTLLACLLLALSACGGVVEDGVLDVTYNPYRPLVVVAPLDASDEELRSIDAALALWNERGGFQLTREPLQNAPRVPIRFERGAPAHHGIYLDEEGDIVINREIDAHHARTITIAHELGHAFGLWHIESRTSVMNPGNTSVEPTDADVADVDALWDDIVSTHDDVPSHDDHI